ncbi:MAG: M48 family metallopeptidase [Planctomycetota bacterium]|nr:M48 family metallopeptidase [Planctomycetota bacterium]MDG1983838.1 M48 family metallopeptidase [Planctomycetota bacterium]
MQDEFKTHMVLDGFQVAGGQRRPTKLTLDLEGIAADGGAIEPWRHVKLRRDEADGAVLVVTRTRVLGSDEPGFLRSLEGAAGNTLDRELAKLVGGQVGFKGSSLIGCVGFIAFAWVLVTAVPGCFRSTMDATVDQLPYSVDEELGRVTEDSMETDDVVEDAEVQAAIEQMVDRLSDRFEDTDVDPAEVTWSVRVVDSEEVNAFALPGGYITVYTGLIREATSPDMVAGVIGHEMAHVLQRHGLRRVANQLGLFAGVQLIFGGTGGLVGMAGDVLALAKGREWDRAQETEADVLGTTAMIRAGLDARELGEFFLILKEKNGETPGVLGWMSTHPMHSTRVEDIEAQVDATEGVEANPLDLDWADILRRVEAPEDD